MAMPLAERAVLPPEDPGRLGGARAALTTRRAQGAALVGPNGERLDVPPEVFEIFREVVEAGTTNGSGFGFGCSANASSCT